MYLWLSSFLFTESKMHFSVQCSMWHIYVSMDYFFHLYFLFYADTNNSTDLLCIFFRSFTFK